MPCLSHGKPQRETTVGPHSHPLSHLSRLSVPPTVHTTPSTPRREKMRRSHARGSPRTDLKQLAFGEWLLWGSGAGSIFDGTLLRKKASEHMEPPTLCPSPCPGGRRSCAGASAAAGAWRFRKLCIEKSRKLLGSFVPDNSLQPSEAADAANAANAAIPMLLLPPPPPPPPRRGKDWMIQERRRRTDPQGASSAKRVPSRAERSASVGS